MVNFMALNNAKNKNIMPLIENEVEQYVRDYLESKEWNASAPKLPGEHGVDIVAFHQKWRKRYLIEVKGESKSENKSTQEAYKHNSFWTMLGQILTRMNIEGNSKNKARYYAIAFPKKWEKTYRKKIKNMEYGWKLLKLKVFLVDSKGKVEEISHLKMF